MLSFRRSVIGFLVTATLVCAVQISSARATVIYNNFGAGDSFQAFTFHSITGDFTQGFQFPVSAGQNYKLDTITIALSLLGGTNDVTVKLQNDAAGSPGAVIESFHFTNLPDFFSSPNPPLVGTSTLHPLLLGGSSYWLIADAADVPGDTEAAWHFNDQGAILPLASRTDPGPFVVTAAADGGAFRIEGTVDTTGGGAVAEPASVLLLGIGLVALFSRKRLRVE